MKYFIEFTNYSLQQAIVLKCFESNDNFVMSGVNNFLEVTKEVYDYIKSQIDIARILFNNSQTTLTISSLSLYEYNIIDKAKLAANRKVTEFVQFKNNMLFQIAFVKFVFYNNALINKGYFITDANRDQKYAEIISSGDVALKELFISYLEIVEFMQSQLYMFDKIFSTLNDIENAASVSEIEAAILVLFPPQ